MLEERNFKTDLFAQYPNQQQIAWPRLDSVKLDLKDLTFRLIEKNFPQLSTLRELRLFDRLRSAF